MAGTTAAGMIAVGGQAEAARRRGTGGNEPSRAGTAHSPVANRDKGAERSARTRGGLRPLARHRVRRRNHLPSQTRGGGWSPPERATVRPDALLATLFR